MHRRTFTALAALAATVSVSAFAADEIRIAHVYSKTGPLEAYGKQTQTGLMMGLEYATGGTMMVAGKKIVHLCASSRRIKYFAVLIMCTASIKGR